MTLVLVVAIPLVTALAIAVVGGRLGRRTLGILTTVAMALSFGAALSMVASLRDRPSLTAFVGPWLPLPGADLALVVDSSMLAVTLAVTGVAALIALYSIDYLSDDTESRGFFAAFALLVGGTLLVILAANLLLVFAGWELAGVAAYLLVGHHRDRAPVAHAAVTLFVTERIGDAALLSGTLVLLSELHTVDLAQLGGVSIEHGSMAGGALAAASVLLVIGALAKSAQIPLHGWLADSAEAATPVSAVLQTVAVTSGVVLLMRMRSILVPDVLHAAAFIGGLTAFAAALVAIGQRDVRRVLAWSTISQVGLMFVAAGLGALFAARFQLMAHALLKAVLVLSAGSVRRAVGDESDIERYGGLWSRMRWTAGAFGVGTLALAGIPPAAGFFAIAAIVSAALTESEALLTVLVLLATLASAFAGVRLFALMFAAPAASAREAHEPPPLQDIPFLVLALGALGFGAVVSAGILPIGSGPTDTTPLWLLSATFAVALAGAVSAWLGYRHGLPPAARIENAMQWARNGLGTDAAYARGIARPVAAAARELEAGAERLTERAVDRLAGAAVSVSRTLRHSLPEGPQARQAVVLAGTLALLAFWTVSGR